MNIIEQGDARRIGGVIRSARKLRGLSQASLSRDLQIAQATFSGIEQGRLAISASHWFQLARVLRIPPQHSFEEGIIDNLDDMSDAEDTGFKIPKRYLMNAVSTLRGTQPFFQLFIERRGEAALNAFLKERLKVDPDICRIYSLRVSLRFTLDVAAELVRSGHLNMHTLGDVAHMLRNPQTHGRLASVYRQAQDRVTLIETLIENMAAYESNFQYSIIHRSENTLDIESKPADFMRYFSYREEELPNIVNLYRSSFIEGFSQYLGDSQPIQVKIIPSSTKRKTECIFRLTI